MIDSFEDYILKDELTDFEPEVAEIVNSSAIEDQDNYLSRVTTLSINPGAPSAQVGLFSCLVSWTFVIGEG